MLREELQGSEEEGGGSRDAGRRERPVLGGERRGGGVKPKHCCPLGPLSSLAFHVERFRGAPLPTFHRWEICIHHWLSRIAIMFNVIASPVLPMEKNMGLEWLPGDHGQGVIHL